MKFSIIHITALLAAVASAAPDFIEDHPSFIAKRQGCGGNSGYSGYSGGGYSGGGYSGGGYSGYKKRDIESTSMSIVKRLFGRQNQSNPCRPNAQCQTDDNCIGGTCYNPNPQCQVYGTCQCAGS